MVHAQDTKEVLLAITTIDHPLIINGPLRIVQDLQDLVSNGHTYTAFPFQVTLPADTEDGLAKVVLRIDNVDQSIATTIRSLPPTTPPTVQIDLVIASQPDVVEVSLPGMKLRTVSGDMFAIEGECKMDEDDLIPFPEGSFNPRDFPGIFK